MQSHSRTEEEIKAKLVTERLKGQGPSFNKVAVSDDDKWCYILSFLFKEGVYSIDGIAVNGAKSCAYCINVMINSNREIAHKVSMTNDDLKLRFELENWRDIVQLKAKADFPLMTSGTMYAGTL